MLPQLVGNILCHPELQVTYSMRLPRVAGNIMLARVVGNISSYPEFQVTYYVTPGCGYHIRLNPVSANILCYHGLPETYYVISSGM